MPDVTLKKKDRRPRWYNLSLFALPLPGLVSILHRISGLLLYLAIPATLYLLEAALASPERFLHADRMVNHPLSQLAIFGVLWAIAHHWCAGVRHLLMDVHVGIDLPMARRTSRLVLISSGLLTAAFAWVILW